MKTTISTIIACIFFLTSASAQEQSTIFEKASLVSSDKASYVLLNWKQGQENTSYYLVERSSNGVDFKQAAMVFTSEMPDFKNYKFKDSDISSANGAIYYRISIVNDKKEITRLPIKKVLVVDTLFQIQNNGPFFTAK